VDFEWNSDRADSNIAKHGVDFVTAAAVFADPNRLVSIDTGHSDVEQRYRVIGAVGGMVLFVVYTTRVKTCRISSARKASRDEREACTLSA
jgi:uncharacterized protein